MSKEYYVYGAYGVNNEISPFVALSLLTRCT